MKSTQQILRDTTPRRTSHHIFCPFDIQLWLDRLHPFNVTKPALCLYLFWEQWSNSVGIILCLLVLYMWNTVYFFTNETEMWVKGDMQSILSNQNAFCALNFPNYKGNGNNSHLNDLISFVFMQHRSLGIQNNVLIAWCTSFPVICSLTPHLWMNLS